MLTDDELKAIEQRANAATPGPWSGLKYFWRINGADRNLVVRDMGTGRHAKENQANQDFISCAREDIPALLSDVRELKAEIERLREVIFVARSGADILNYLPLTWVKVNQAVNILNGVLYLPEEDE